MKTSTYSKFVTIAQQAILLSFVVTATLYPASAQTAVTCDQLIGWVNDGNTSEISTAIDADEDIKDCQNSDGYTPLNWAAKQGKLDVVNVLLSESADTEIADTVKGRTPLFWAVTKERIEIVRALVNADASADVTDSRGKMPLNILATRNTSDKINSIANIFKLLITSSAADINDSNLISKRVHKYAAENDPEMLKTLIVASGNLETHYGGQNTFLLYAAKKNMTDLAGYVVKDGGNINVTDGFNVTPLNAAIVHENLEMVDMILETNNMSILPGVKPPLIVAIETGNLILVETLLEKGANVNAVDNSDNSALILATEKKHLDIVKALLTRITINVNATKINEKTALIIAAEDGSWEIAKEILNQAHVTDTPPPNGKSALIIFAEKKRWILAEKLLEQKDINVNINATGDDGKTALIIAAEEGEWVVVTDILGKNRVSVNVTGDDGKTALIIAAEEGEWVVVTKILDNDSVNVNVTGDNGKTALIIAAEEGEWVVVTKILDNDSVNVNVTGDNGKTALIIALENRKWDVVTKILDNGSVNVKLTGDNGKTALMIALENRRWGIVTKISGKGGDINEVDANGNTALLIATSTYDWVNVLNLLKNPTINVTLANKEGKNALIRASERTHFEVIKILLSKVTNVDDKKAFANYENKRGETAMICVLHWSGPDRNKAAAELLLAGADVPLNGTRWGYARNTLHNIRDTKDDDLELATTLARQIFTTKPLTVNLAVNYGIETYESILLLVVNEVPNTVTAGGGDMSTDNAVSMINAVYDDGGEDKDNKAYHAAVDRNLDERILEAFDDRPTMTMSGTYRAAQNYPDLQEHLKGNSDNLNAPYDGNNSILLYFAKKFTADMVMVNALITDKVSLNITSSYYRLPALTWRANYAASFTDNLAFRALINAGAAKEVPGGTNNWTPLMFIAARAKYELADLLLSNTGGTRASVDIKDSRGYTALHYAASSTLPEVTDETLAKTVAKLINATANIAIVANNGNTALILAAYNGYSQVVEKLLISEKGNNARSSLGFCHRRNRQGNSALDYANSKKSSSANHQKVYNTLIVHCPAAPRTGRSPSTSGDDSGEQDLQIDLPPAPLLTL